MEQIGFEFDKKSIELAVAKIQMAAAYAGTDRSPHPQGHGMGGVVDDPRG